MLHQKSSIALSLYILNLRKLGWALLTIFSASGLDQDLKLFTEIISEYGRMIVLCNHRIYVATRESSQSSFAEDLDPVVLFL